MTRRVLVILSNRHIPSKPHCLFDIECETDGSILSERKLRGLPKKPAYDEVWENDDGKLSIDSCNRFKRHYKHVLLKK